MNGDELALKLHRLVDQIAQIGAGQPDGARRQTFQIDGELVVTLPVANNLPWVAALAGGPAVAAGVFVVSKVFEKQVSRLSSAVYGVTGDIQSPEVEFRRLFDDQLTPNPGAPAGGETGGG